MITFDLCVFNPQTVDYRLRGVAISGGTLSAGAPTLSRTDGGGFWRCEMSGIWLRGREMLQAARALDAALDGGLERLIVPDRDVHLGPVPTGVSWGVVSRFHIGAALRATMVTIEVDAGPILIGGEHFSLQHPGRGRRMYEIRKVISWSGDAATVQIRPPLREAVAAGLAVDFNTPGCEMKLVNPDDFFEPIRSGRSAYLKPQFVEAF